MRYVHWFILALFIGACIPAPTPEPTSTTVAPLMLMVEENPYRPQPEDESLRLAGAIITSTSLSERFDLDPFRVELRILGALPSVCNELRIDVAPPNENYQVFVKVYSIANPHIKCDDVFQQFEAGILLGIYSTGRYTVWVNEGLVGDFSTY